MSPAHAFAEPRQPCRAERSDTAWPRRLARPEPVPTRPTPVPAASRPLLFDEDEVARLAAAAAREAAAAASDAVAARLAAAQAEALAAIAQALAAAAQARAADQALEAAQARRLVRAVLRAVAGAHLASAGETLLARLGEMLRELPEAAVAVLHVHPDLVEPLRARLPDLVRAAGLAGPVEILGEPGLEPGGVRLTWPEGWIEHLPAWIEQQLGGHLASTGGDALPPDGHGEPGMGSAPAENFPQQGDPR
ncbi:MAG: FliH/SctL family protein [Geminicoccaceae bacterium]